MSKKNKLNVLIIGAGSIGALKSDKYDSPDSENVLTHAHAVYKSSELNLLGIIDTNFFQAKFAGEKWGCKYYSSISDFADQEYKGKVDIVVIAVPESFHFSVLKEVIGYGIIPDIVICEKPFGNSLRNARKIIQICKRYAIKLYVNYNRRFTALNEFCNDIFNNKYGYPVSCSVHYTRGFVRDGCHAIDLLNLMFGEFIEGTLINKDNSIVDNNLDDTTDAVHLMYKGCRNIFFVPHDGRDYSIFDFDIYTSTHNIKIVNHGSKIIVRKVIDEPIYGDYKSLFYSNDYETIDIDLTKSLENLYSGIYTNKILSRKEDLIKSALDVHKVIKEVRGE